MIAVKVSVDFAWQQVGQVQLNAQGKLIFPKVPQRPGLYRFDFEGSHGPSAYIGETDLLPRRLQHYRSPGPSQATNIRLEALLKGEIAAGKAVLLSTVTDGIAAFVDGQRRCLDLARKADRVFLEHAAILSAYTAGLTLVNL
jgi:hypothetical protein